MQNAGFILAGWLEIKWTQYYTVLFFLCPIETLTTRGGCLTSVILGTINMCVTRLFGCFPLLHSIGHSPTQPTVKPSTSLTFSFYKVTTTLQQTVSKQSTHWNPSTDAFYLYLSRYNITKPFYVGLYHSAIMWAVSQFLIKNLLSPFNKCEKIENKGGDAGYDRGLAVLGLAVALLALLLAFISYRSSRRFNHPASSSPPSPFIRVYPPAPLFIVNHIILIYSQSHNPLQQAPKTLLQNRSAAIPPTELGRVNYFFFFNDSANAPFAGANLGTVTLSYQNNGISRGDVGLA